MTSELDIAQIEIISYFSILLLISLFYSALPIIGFSFNVIIFSLFAGSGFDRIGIYNHYNCHNIDGFEILPFLISKLSCGLPDRWGFYFFLSVISYLAIFLILTQTDSFFKKFVFAAYISAITIFSIGPARQDVCVLLLITTTIIPLKYSRLRLVSQLFATYSHKSLIFFTPLLFKIKVTLPKLIILLLVGLVLIKYINFDQNYIVILFFSYIQEREEIYLGQSTAMITAILYLVYSFNARYNLNSSESSAHNNNLLLLNLSIITSLMSLIGILASDFINLSIFTRYIRIPTIIVPYLLLFGSIKSNKFIARTISLMMIFKIFNSYNTIPEDYFDSTAIYFQLH